jgi:hypothetical protein
MPLRIVVLINYPLADNNLLEIPTDTLPASYLQTDGAIMATISEKGYTQ